MIEGAIATFVWLGLGGWAFRHLSKEISDSLMGALFVGCILFAPFAFGAALADVRDGKKS